MVHGITRRLLLRRFLLQVVKSKEATISIPELEFEVAASKEAKAIISTVEGVLRTHIDDLASDQPVRRVCRLAAPSWLVYASDTPLVRYT